jgi:hypothetical protein
MATVSWGRGNIFIVITDETILFEFGADGGGATVYKLLNGKIIEKGSSGGILDEEEDPIKTWEKIYDNWETWWLNFTTEHQDFWIYFHPSFIHDDIKQFIRVAVDNYKSNRDYSYHKENWNQKLTDKNQNHRRK